LVDATSSWRPIAILIVAGVIAAFQVGKAAVAVPLLRDDLAISLLTASLVVSAYGLLGAVAGFAFGVATSRVSARTALVAGLAAVGLGSIAGAVAPSGGVLIATRIIEGCGFLAVAVTAPRQIGALAVPRDRETALAFWGVHLPAGTSIMMFAAPFLPVFGWRSLWLANGCIALLYALVIARMHLPADRPRMAAPATRADIGRVIRSPGPLLVAIAFGVYTLHFSALAGLLPTLLVERLGVSVAAAGSISAATVVANAIGNLAAGVLLRWRTPLWAIIGGAFAVAGVAALGIFAPSTPAFVVALLAATSLAVTGLVPASIYAAAPLVMPAAALLGATLGLIVQSSNIGTLLGAALLGGWVEHLGWSTAPLLFGTIALVEIAIALKLRSLLAK
jgi:predicted MFS family arabinose efflux permease